MYKTFFFIIVCFSVFFSFGQGYLPVGARSNSMANASVALSDVWAFHHNPGALGSLKNAGIGLCYENRFLLKDLQRQGLVYVQPIKVGVISFGAQLYGFDIYRTTRIGAGYGMKISNKLFAGVQMNFQRIQFSSNYGSKNTMTAEVGILANLTDEWRLGISVFNLGRSKLSTFQNERLTTLMRLGTVYQLSEKALFAFEVEKNINYQLRFKGAIEYKPLKTFYLRGGIAAQPIECTFGFGCNYKSIQLDLGSAYQQLLGWSPHFSLTYVFDKLSK